jgi:hypothetical protein
MAAIASTDITTTIIKPQILRGSPGAERRNIVKMVFGDGSVTYGTGVPMTSPAALGLAKSLDFMNVDGGAGSTLAWKYDKAANTLRAYGVIATTAALAEYTSGQTIAAATIYAEAIGW